MQEDKRWTALLAKERGLLIMNGTLSKVGTGKNSRRRCIMSVGFYGDMVS